MKELKNDYYESMPSYIKIVMEITSESASIMEKYVVKEIFNNMINNLSDEKKIELNVVSSLFENTLYNLDVMERINLINALYLTYIKGIIYSFQNGDFDLVKIFLNRMDEKVKELSGFYGIFENNNILNSARNIR